MSEAMHTPRRLSEIKRGDTIPMHGEMVKVAYVHHYPDGTVVLRYLEDGHRRTNYTGKADDQL